MGSVIKNIATGLVVGFVVQATFDLTMYGTWRAARKLKEKANG